MMQVRQQQGDGIVRGVEISLFESCGNDCGSQNAIMSHIPPTPNSIRFVAKILVI